MRWPALRITSSANMEPLSPEDASGVSDINAEATDSWVLPWYYFGDINCMLYKKPQHIIARNSKLHLFGQMTLILGGDPSLQEILEELDGNHPQDPEFIKIVHYALTDSERGKKCYIWKYNIDKEHEYIWPPGLKICICGVEDGASVSSESILAPNILYLPFDFELSDTGMEDFFRQESENYNPSIIKNSIEYNELYINTFFKVVDNLVMQRRDILRERPIKNIRESIIKCASESEETEHLRLPADMVLLPQEAMHLDRTYVGSKDGKLYAVIGLLPLSSECSHIDMFGPPPPEDILSIIGTDSPEEVFDKSDSMMRRYPCDGFVG